MIPNYHCSSVLQWSASLLSERSQNYVPPGVGVQGGKYSHPTIFRGVGIPPQIAKSHPPGVGENAYILGDTANKEFDRR